MALNKRKGENPVFIFPEDEFKYIINTTTFLIVNTITLMLLLLHSCSKTSVKAKKRSQFQFLLKATDGSAEE